jgi:hypothetical protein
MKSLKQKYIEYLDKTLYVLLNRDKKQCEEFNGKNLSPEEWKARHVIVHMTKTQIETILLFANKTLGRVEVNKLCRKYKINNADHGGLV